MDSPKYFLTFLLEQLDSFKLMIILFVEYSLNIQVEKLYGWILFAGF